MENNRKQGQVVKNSISKIDKDVADRRKHDNASGDSKTLAQCLINVTEQMSKLEARLDEWVDSKVIEVDMKVLCKVYETVNRVLNSGSSVREEDLGTNFVEVLQPLKHAISRMIELDRHDDVKTLFSMFGPLIWQHIKRPLLFSSLVKMVETRGKTLSDYVSSCKSASLAGEIPSIFSYWNQRDCFLMNNALLEKMDGDCYESTLSLLQFLFSNLETIKGPIMRLAGSKRTHENFMEQNDEIDRYDTMFEIMRNCKNEDYTFLNVLLIINHKDLLQEVCVMDDVAKADTVERLFSKRILTLLVDISVSKDLAEWFYHVNKNLKRPRHQNLVKFIALNEASQARKNSIGFVLEMMDHGLEIDYVTSKCIPKYTLLSLRTIHKMANDKLKIYSEFNDMKCKASLLSVLVYFNFLVTNSVLKKSNNIELPPTIMKIFEYLKLPPIPKSNYLLDQRQPEELEADVTSTLRNIDDLFQSLTILVNLINLFLVDEMNAYQFMNTYSSTEIYEKLVFKNVDLVIVSLFATFLLIESSDKDDFGFQVIENAVAEAFHKLLNLNLKNINNSFIWVSLINFANDTCYSYLNLVPHFEKLLNILIQKNRNVLEDSLVKSGLQFFLTSFSNEDLQIQPLCQLLDSQDTCDSSTLVDLSVEDYKHLYLKETPMKPVNANSISELHPSSTAISYDDQDLTNRASTPLIHAYMTNSARQQSVHVDSFGKI